MNDDALTTPSNDEPRPRGTLRVVVVEMALVLFVVVAVGGTIRGASAPDPSDVRGSELSTTVSLESLPVATAEMYKYAADHADHFASLPCHCGCDRSLGHRNLEDCFVNPAGGWDAHAAGCGVCIAEARTAQELLDADTVIGAVRQVIIDRYGPLPAASPLRQEP